jgi:hypothetical protein
MKVLFSYLFIKDTYFELTIKYMALGTLTRIGNVQKGSFKDLLTTKMTIYPLHSAAIQSQQLLKIKKIHNYI